MDEANANAPPSQPEPTPQRAGGATTVILWLLFSVFVVYPLSIGPAARLHQSSPAARPAIEAFYKPITIVIDSSPPVRSFFMWYVHTIWRAE